MNNKNIDNLMAATSHDAAELVHTNKATPYEVFDAYLALAVTSIKDTGDIEYAITGMMNTLKVLGEHMGAQVHTDCIMQNKLDS